MQGKTTQCYSIVNEDCGCTVGTAWLTTEEGNVKTVAKLIHLLVDTTNGKGRGVQWQWKETTSLVSFWEMKNEWGKKMYSVLQYKWEKWGSLGNWETGRGGEGGCPILREAEHDMYRWQTVGWSPSVCWGVAQSQCVLCYDVAGPPASVSFIPSLKGSVVTGCVTMCRHTHTLSDRLWTKVWHWVSRNFAQTDTPAVQCETSRAQEQHCINWRTHSVSQHGTDRQHKPDCKIVKVKVNHNRSRRPRGGVGVLLYSFFSLSAKRRWVLNATPRPL